MYDKDTIITNTFDALADSAYRWPAEASDVVVPQIIPIYLSKPFSLYLRVADPTARWSGPLWQVERREGEPVCRLYGGMEREEPALIFELWTDYNDEPLRLAMPFDISRMAGWHDIVVRYTGVNLQLFIDGVLVDEDWPAGNLRVSSRCLLGTDEQTEWSGNIARVALWARMLSDAEDCRAKRWAGRSDRARTGATWRRVRAEAILATTRLSYRRRGLYALFP